MIENHGPDCQVIWEGAMTRLRSVAHPCQELQVVRHCVEKKIVCRCPVYRDCFMSRPMLAKSGAVASPLQRVEVETGVKSDTGRHRTTSRLLLTTGSCNSQRLRRPDKSM